MPSFRPAIEKYLASRVPKVAPLSEWECVDLTMKTAYETLSRYIEDLLAQKPLNAERLAALAESKKEFKKARSSISAESSDQDVRVALSLVEAKVSSILKAANAVEVAPASGLNAAVATEAQPTSAVNAPAAAESAANTNNSGSALQVGTASPAATPTHVEQEMALNRANEYQLAASDVQSQIYNAMGCVSRGCFEVLTNFTTGYLQTAGLQPGMDAAATLVKHRRDDATMRMLSDAVLRFIADYNQCSEDVRNSNDASGRVAAGFICALASKASSDLELVRHQIAFSQLDQAWQACLNEGIVGMQSLVASPQKLIEQPVDGPSPNCLMDLQPEVEEPGLAAPLVPSKAHVRLRLKAREEDEEKDTSNAGWEGGDLMNMDE